MIGQQSSIFPKQIKLDDYEQFTEGNIIRVMETSNMLVGNGGKTSNAAIVLAKCLHFMSEEFLVKIQKKKILQLGSGMGLLGIYLASLGADIILSDLPQVKQMLCKNINLNKKMYKGSAQFQIINWKNIQIQENNMIIEKKQEKELSQASTSEYLNPQQLIKGTDLTIVCECGGFEDLKYQLRFMGREGMILAFIQRAYENGNEYLEARQLQKYLYQRQLECQKIQSYHPDYIDERVCIYKIWK